jgi:hypothetical protein
MPRLLCLSTRSHSHTRLRRRYLQGPLRPLRLLRLLCLPPLWWSCPW